MPRKALAGAALKSEATPASATAPRASRLLLLLLLLLLLMLMLLVVEAMGAWLASSCVASRDDVRVTALSLHQQMPCRELWGCQG